MKRFTWLYLLLPQVALLPLSYLATLEPAGSIGLKFWMTLVMVYVLYVCFWKIEQSKTKSELEKVERTIYSGIITYFILSVYVGISFFEHPTFTENRILLILALLLQVAQYVMIGMQLQKTKKVSKKYQDSRSKFDKV